MSEVRYLRPEDVAERMGISRPSAVKLMETMPYVDVATPGSRYKRLRVREDAFEKWLITKTHDRRRR